MREVVARGRAERGSRGGEARNQPVMVIAVCLACYARIKRHGEVVVFMRGRPWVIGLPGGGAVGCRS